MVVDFDDLWTNLERQDISGWHEGVDVEFKLAAGRDGRGELPGSLWETYSAMANTSGGLIVLGVKEHKDGTCSVNGVPDCNKVLKAFWSSLNNPNKVNVNLLKDEDVRVVEFRDDDNVLLNLIAITIPRAKRTEAPIYLNGNPIGGTYRRMNDGDFKCPQTIVERMLADRQYDTLDMRICVNYDINDVDVSSLQAYRNLFNVRYPAHPFAVLSNQDFLEQIGGYARDRASGETGLTLAGLLMFGNLRAILDNNPSYVVDYREYGHTGENERWIDRLTTDFSWSGNLFEFCRKTLQKLYSDLKVPFALKSDGLREDESPVHIALREALVNTLIHADYAGSTPIVVAKYPGHYEFVNPGLLRVPREMVYKGGVANSDCRNRTLQKMFELIGYAEQAGSGFPKILAGWKSQDWKRPLLKEDVPAYRTHLTLLRESIYPVEVLANIRNNLGSRFDELSPLERVIVVESSLQRVNHADLMSVIDGHPADVSAALRKLVDGGFVCAEGKGRGKVYFLPGYTLGHTSGQTLGHTSGQTLGHTSISEEMQRCIALLGDSDMSSRELMGLLHRTNKSKFHSDVMRPLLAKGLIERTDDNIHNPNLKYRAVRK